jgi:hypothetical protein
LLGSTSTDNQIENEAVYPLTRTLRGMKLQTRSQGLDYWHKKDRKRHES